MAASDLELGQTLVVVVRQRLRAALAEDALAVPDFEVVARGEDHDVALHRRRLAELRRNQDPALRVDLAFHAVDAGPALEAAAGLVGRRHLPEARLDLLPDRHGVDADVLAGRVVAGEIHRRRLPLRLEVGAVRGGQLEPPLFVDFRLVAAPQARFTPRQATLVHTESRTGGQTCQRETAANLSGPNGLRILFAGPCGGEKAPIPGMVSVP